MSDDETMVLILAGAAAYFLFCYSRGPRALTDPNAGMSPLTQEFCLPATLLAAGLVLTGHHFPI